MRDETPYDDLDDPAIARLSRALNSIPGVWTMGSCGGHENGELPPEFYRVTIRPETRPLSYLPTRKGWLGLEFAAWLIYSAGWEDNRVELLAHARPPFLNDPGTLLRFSIYGIKEKLDADALAEYIEDTLGTLTDRGRGYRGSKPHSHAPGLFRHSRFSLPGSDFPRLGRKARSGVDG